MEKLATTPNILNFTKLRNHDIIKSKKTGLVYNNATYTTFQKN